MQNQMQLLNIFHYYFIVNRNSLQIPNKRQMYLPVRACEKDSKKSDQERSRYERWEKKKILKIYFILLQNGVFVCVLFFSFGMCVCV